MSLPSELVSPFARQLASADGEARAALSRLADLYLVADCLEPLDPDPDAVHEGARAGAHRDESTDPTSGLPQVQSLRGGAELEAFVRCAALSCPGEVIGFLSDAVAGLALAQVVRGSGPDVRLLVPHTVHGDLRAIRLAKQLVADGGEVRLACAPQREILVLGPVVVYVTAREQDDVSWVVVRHQPTVDLLRDVVLASWASAKPFSVGASSRADVVDDLHRVIVELLALGLTDEAVAKRLGMSVRTCRRHIASLFDRIGARSRFQAGALVATHGLTRSAGGHLSAVARVPQQTTTRT